MEGSNTAATAADGNQPPPPPPPPPAVETSAAQSRHPPVPAPWSTGLFDCCDDVGNCCVTSFCPCVTFGQIAEAVDQGSTSCGVSGTVYALLMCATGCACCFSCIYRSRLRAQLGLEESPCNDAAVHCCCETCALCQEYRELNYRGAFNFKDAGWQKQETKSSTLPPDVQGGMQR